MNCLHKMKEHKTLALLYCERCPFVQWIGPPQVPAPAPAPETPRPPQRPRPTGQTEFPFGMPVAVGANDRSMFESPTPEDDDSIIELERQFFGADPASQAEMIERFRRERNMQRVDDGDEPESTWRPGEEAAPGQPNLDAAAPPE